MPAFTCIILEPELVEFCLQSTFGNPAPLKYVSKIAHGGVINSVVLPTSFALFLLSGTIIEGAVPSHPSPLTVLLIIPQLTVSYGPIPLVAGLERLLQSSFERTLSPFSFVSVCLADTI
jgi:hypothetical protein